jgi:hypothetical protein
MVLNYGNMLIFEINVFLRQSKTEWPNIICCGQFIGIDADQFAAQRGPRRIAYETRAVRRAVLTCRTSSGGGAIPTG